MSNLREHNLRESIQDLPIDKSVPAEYENHLVERFFKENPKAASVVTDELKECAMIVVLCLIFSSEQLRNIIDRFVPSASRNDTLMIAIKCSVVLVLYYFAKNFSLIRK